MGSPKPKLISMVVYMIITLHGGTESPGTIPWNFPMKDYLIMVTRILGESWPVIQFWYSSLKKEKILWNGKGETPGA